MKRKIIYERRSCIYVKCTHLTNLTQNVFTGFFDSDTWLLHTDSYTDEQTVLSFLVAQFHRRNGEYFFRTLHYD